MQSLKNISKENELIIMNSIKQFLNNHPRNRLIIVRDNSLDISFVNIGRLLSEKLQGTEKEKDLPFIAAKGLDEILDMNLQYLEKIGQYTAIENLGILMERELKFDLGFLLEKYSRGTTLIVKWEGEIDDRNLYFLSKEKGVKIELKNISHLIV